MFILYVVGNKYFDWFFKLYSLWILKGNVDFEDMNLFCVRVIV